MYPLEPQSEAEQHTWGTELGEWRAHTRVWRLEHYLDKVNTWLAVELILAKMLIDSCNIY
jgi:hypothetical protein